MESCFLFCKFRKYTKFIHIINHILTSIQNLGRDKIELKIISIQEINGSYFAYLPKIWVQSSGIQKGDKMVWTVDEGDHKTLHLKKKMGDKNVL